MNFQFKQLGNYTDAKTFLEKRQSLLKKLNDEMEQLEEKVKKQLIIFAGKEDITLHSMPLKAIVFHTKDDREAKLSKGFVNFGEHYIETIEVCYSEWFATIAGKTILVQCSGTTDCLPKEFIKQMGFGGFNDENLSWENNCFFLKKEEYLLFKKTITDLGKMLGIIK